MPKRSSRPRDPNQLAKLIVDMATGQTPKDTVDDRTDIQKAAAALGRLGGLKGGKARAEKLSQARRRLIAKKAAIARWKPKSGRGA